MGFPLFRLPQLAILEVFQHCNPLEVFTISKTSTRAKHFVRTLKRKVHSVQLILSRNFKMRMMENDNSTVYSFKVVQNLDRKVAKPEGNIITLNVDRPLEGALDLFKHFQEIFSLSLHYLSIDTAFFDNPQLELLCIAARASFPSIYLAVESREKLDQLLRVLSRPLPRLAILFLPHWCGGSNSDVPIQSVQCEALTLTFLARLAQLQLIMTFDFITAEFNRIVMPSGDLNAFLKSWKQGKTHQRMKRLEMRYFSYLNLAIAFEGLEPTSDDPDVLYSDFGEIGIDGTDGKIAKVEIDEHWGITSFVITVDD